MALVGAGGCVKCHRKAGERHVVTTKAPTGKALERMVYASVAKATDGCRVEPDGVCEHGHRSWLLQLGMI